MFETLFERQLEYENASNFSLMRRVPIIIRVDGCGFSRLTRKLKQPYEPLFLEAMAETMLEVAADLAGAVFAYCQSDEISFVLRNDQSLDSKPYFNNRVQKLSSVVASMTTLSFNNFIATKNLPLVGKALFDARVFAVPSLVEATNNILARQQDGIRNAIAKSSQAVFTKKFGRKQALAILHGKSAKEKLEMLASVAGIDYEEEYPSSYRHGVAAYKIPVVIPATEKQDLHTRKKWVLNWEFPKIAANYELIFSIINNGHDVFRSDSLSALKEVL